MNFLNPKRASDISRHVAPLAETNWRGMTARNPLSNRASRLGTMPRPALDRWRSPVADCIVTDPARLAFIFSTYPESDQGRPGIIVAQGHGTKQKIRKTDSIENADYELDVDEDAVTDENDVLEVAA